MKMPVVQGCLISILLNSPPLYAQKAIVVRPIGPATAVSKDSLGSIGSIRQLSDGRILVNETSRRRLLLLNTDLSSATVIADSAGTSVRAYGSQPGGLFLYLGDSSLFVDPVGMSVLVIDPRGEVSRLMALPRPRDASAILARNSGIAGSDSRGRLIYSVRPEPGGIVRGRGGVPTAAPASDSAPILRADLASRTIDTIGMIRVAVPKMVMVPASEGRLRSQSVQNPLPVVDGWGVLANGNVAIVRGTTYHVDLIDPDGKARSALKAPFDWQRLTDEGKVALLDTFKRTFIRTPPPAPEPLFVEPGDLPDYRPPFTQGAVRSDMDGNLWVRTTTLPPEMMSGYVYDVFNDQGILSDRVLVPNGRTLVGFGKGGFAYFAVYSGRRYVLERRRVN